MALKAWRPRRVGLLSAYDQQAALLRSVGIHDVDPRRPFPGGTEGNKGPVRGPGGRLIVARVSRELNGTPSIDADEEVSPKLRDEIKEVVNFDGDVAGYYIRRKTMFLGRWIKHCGWYPDYILRLFRKSQGDFNDAIVVHQEDQPAHFFIHPFFHVDDGGMGNVWIFPLWEDGMPAGEPFSVNMGQAFPPGFDADIDPDTGHIFLAWMHDTADHDALERIPGYTVAEVICE